MMYLTLLYWVALALPGFVMIRRWAADELRCGLLGIAALSYLATFVLLTPVAIVLYVTESPLGVFSGVVALAIIIALIETTRQWWWRDIWILFKESWGLPLLLLLAVLVMNARIGAFLGGDATVHLTRIRYLIDHGLSNHDPFVGDFFFPIYHTNLLHAVYASAAQICGRSHLDIWYVSLPWAKLLVVSGVYYLAWTIFERQWLAWVAAIFCLVNRGPMTFPMYPNQLAPYWLLPMALAFVIRACDRPLRYSDAVRLAATTLVTGSLHGLYAAFAFMAAAPILAWISVSQIRRRTGGVIVILACAMALTAGLPFGVVSKIKTPRVAEQHRVYDISPPSSGEYVQTDDGSWMRRLDTLPGFFGGSFVGTMVLGAAFICALLSGAVIRRRAILLASVPLVTALLLYLPPLCSLLFRVFAEEWVVSRYEIVMSLAYCALVPTAIAVLIARLGSGVVLRNVICAATVVGAYFHATFEEPWTWSNQIKVSFASAEVRQERLQSLTRVGQIAQENISRGAVVLSEPAPSMWFTMVYDCRIIASPSASNGVPELDRRLKDMHDMLQSGTDWPTRRGLLKKYGVEYFVPTTGAASDWAKPHVARLIQSPELSLVRLSLE